MDDRQIEQEIVAKGKTAPRVTPADIEAVIVSEHYFTAAQGVIGSAADFPFKRADELAEAVFDAKESPSPLGLLTFCVIVLKNGFAVTGESACASPENFDAQIGRKLAKANAIQKIWPLEGYLLRERLSSQG